MVIHGPEVENFEKEFSEFIGVKYAVAVASGTAALHLSYLALDLGPGDEIIQPAINFVAAANMSLAVGRRLESKATAWMVAPGLNRRRTGSYGGIHKRPPKTV